MNEKGVLFDIQKFSVNDGPGIRTTLFFKGCSLRCQWCHNPESISAKIQLNYNKNKCKLCGKCVEFVGDDRIQLIDGALNIDFEELNTCLELVEICPYKAYGVYGKLYSVDELVDIVMKDKDYYEYSNGGVTFSGGEALNQIDFLTKLAIKLKDLGIHICMDLSGFDPKNDIERTLDFVDEYLLDYKVSDLEKSKLYVGSSIDIHKILSILEMNSKIVNLRCPIIIGVNDDEFHLKSICDISNKYECIKIVDILPYHNMVKSKKFKYLNEHNVFDLPTEEDKLKWLKILRNNSLKNGIIDNKKI